MTRQGLRHDRLRSLRSLAAFVAVAASCRPVLPGDTGIGISCGGLALTSPAVEITLDSTAASSSGRLVLGSLAADATTLEGTIVEIAAQGVVARCHARGGTFKILVRSDTAVDGTLRIAIAEPVTILVRTAAGVQRAAHSFDPAAVSPSELSWSVATR